MSTELGKEIFVHNPEFLKVPSNKRVVPRASDLSTWLRYNSTSANGSAINFVFTAPSTAALLSTKVLLAFNSVGVDFTFVNNSGGTVNAGSIIGSNIFSLRDYPLHRLFNSASITIANSTMALPLNDVLSAMRYCSYDANDQVDLGSLYGAKDELGGAYPLAGTPSSNSLINAVGNVNSQNIVSASHRGMLGIEKITVSINGATPVPYATGLAIPTGQRAVFTVQFSVSELLMLPIFSIIKKQGISLINISQIQLSFVMATTQSMFSLAQSFDANGNITAGGAAGVQLASVAFNPNTGLSPSNCVLSLQWYTSPAGQDYDQQITRSMLDYQRYITSATAFINADPSLNSSVQRITSQTISLPVIPEKIIIYVTAPRAFKQSIQGMGFNDSFCAIRKCFVTLGARSNLLASADTNCLYLNSVMAGLKGVSFQNFKGYAPSPDFANSVVVGPTGSTVNVNYQALSSSPIIIDTASQLGLPSNQAVSLSTPVSLQIQVDVFNPGMTFANGALPGNNNQEPLELYIVCANQSYLTISRSGSSQVVQGGITADDVAQIVAEPIPHEQAHLVEFAGGDIFDSVKDFMRNIAPVGRKVYNALGSIAPFADSALRSMGAGMTGGKKKGLRHMAM